MSLYRILTRHVLAPTYELMRGTHALQYLAELEKSQWWSQEQLEEFQSQRLQKLVHHVYARVPYYRRLMDEYGVRPDAITHRSHLPLLPVLTKNDIRDHANSLLAEGYPRRHLLRGQTGGSTGTPLSFFTSREARLTHGLARSMRALEWAGVHPGDRTVIATKQGTRGPRGGRVLDRLSRRLSRDTYVNASNFSEYTLPGVVEVIRRVRPRALRGYASAVCIIADYIRESGIPAPNVGEVVVGGEQLFDEQRELLHQVFGKNRSPATAPSRTRHRNGV